MSIHSKRKLASAFAEDMRPQDVGFTVALGPALAIRLVPRAAPDAEARLFLRAAGGVLNECSDEGYRSVAVPVTRDWRSGARVLYADFGKIVRRHGEQLFVVITDCDGEPLAIAPVTNSDRYGPAVRTFEVIEPAMISDCGCIFWPEQVPRDRKAGSGAVLLKRDGAVQ